MDLPVGRLPHRYDHGGPQRGRKPRRAAGQDASFAVLRHNMPLVLIMATGSIMGTVLGGLLLGVVPSTVFIPILAALLLISAVKVWRH